MVAQVLADAGQLMAHLDAKVAQAFGLADTGQLQQLRRVERAGADPTARPARASRISPATETE